MIWINYTGLTPKITTYTWQLYKYANINAKLNTGSVWNEIETRSLACFNV